MEGESSGWTVTGHCDFDELVYAPFHTWFLLKILGPTSYLTVLVPISAYKFPVYVPKAVPALMHMLPSIFSPCSVKEISLDLGDLLGPVLSSNPLETRQILKKYLDVRKIIACLRTICWSFSAEGLVL